MSVNSIGIDVAKKTLDICLLEKEGKPIRLQVGNNPNDVPKMVEQLNCYQIKEDTPIVIEATGGYHYGITFALQNQGFKQVCVINPILTKRYLKSAIRKTKTDTIDALTLAYIGQRENLRDYQEKPAEILNKKKVRLFHFLKKQLQQINTKISLAKDMAVLDNFEIKILESTKKHLQKQLNKIKETIVDTESIIVPTTRIVGVSAFQLKAICAELGNPFRFSNHKQVIAFAGVDPSVRESGTSIKGKSHISKRGSKVLRHFLFQSAWGLVMHNPEFREYYEKKRSEGKHYYTCLIAVARKLLCKIHYMRKETLTRISS